MNEQPNKKDFEKKISNSAETTSNMEKKIEKDIEKKVENSIKNNAYVVGEVIVILINIGLIYAVHNVLSWDHSFWDFVKDDFDKIIWAVDLSLIASIIASTIKIFTRQKKYHKIGQIIDNVFTVLSLIVTLSVFPYDFQELWNVSWINTAIKTVMIFVSLGVTIGTGFEIVKVAMGKYDGEKVKGCC